MTSAQLPLFWKIVTINGAVFCVGTLVLAISPASVSSQVLLSELLILIIGLGVMMVTNALLLRRYLAPVDRVIAHMGHFVVGEPQEPLGSFGAGAGARLAESYQAMADRLAEERAVSDAKALAAQEAERHRIAQELHDEIGQRITVVLLALKRLQGQAPPELAAQLDDVRETMREGLDDVRSVARRLRPGVLEDLGLHSALAGLVTDVSAGVVADGVHIRRSFAPGLPDLDSSADLVIFRVAQEALTNVVRHAHARHVEVALRRVGDHIRLEVSDDGRGAAQIEPGAGVAGMHERARLVGGELSIDSAPGRGTTVVLTVPVSGGTP